MIDLSYPCPNCALRRSFDHVVYKQHNCSLIYWAIKGNQHIPVGIRQSPGNVANVIMIYCSEPVTVEAIRSPLEPVCGAIFPWHRRHHPNTRGRGKIIYYSSKRPSCSTHTAARIGTACYRHAVSRTAQAGYRTLSILVGPLLTYRARGGCSRCSS